MSDELEIKELLKQHIEDSNEWRKNADLRMLEMQASITRYNQYEVGAKAIISIGKAIIYVTTILGGAWMFFHDYIVRK